MASNLLEKLSRQIQVMEKLSAVSDENIGNISSVIEGEPLQGHRQILTTNNTTSLPPTLPHPNPHLHLFMALLGWQRSLLGCRIEEGCHSSVVTINIMLQPLESKQQTPNFF